jgi:hypothetical protein
MRNELIAERVQHGQPFSGSPEDACRFYFSYPATVACAAAATIAEPKAQSDARRGGRQDYWAVIRGIATIGE